MRTYVLQRLLQMIPVLVFATLLVFSLLLLIPGDPVRMLIGPGEALDNVQIEIIRKEYHLDKPIPLQYLIWVGSVVQGELGRSTRTHRKVIDEILPRAVVTLQLGLVAWVFSVLIAIPAGILSASFRGTPLDFAATIISIGGVAIPGFWLGIMMILLFGVTLGWLPTSGYASLIAQPWEAVRHLVLPAFSLGVTGSAMMMRQTRSALLEVFAQDYIRTARAKGLPRRSVIWVHALRNSLLPVVTVMGLHIGRIFAGAVVIETLFAVPGMGRLMVDSVFQLDFPVVQGCVLLMATTVLFTNFITDMAYGLLDPRIKFG